MRSGCDEDARRAAGRIRCLAAAAVAAATGWLARPPVRRSFAVANGGLRWPEHVRAEERQANPEGS